MDPDIVKNRSGLPQFSRAKQLEWKRKMLVFSFFLTISIIIWLLNALNKNYTTNIKYPITYSRFPANKILISDVPDHLELKVNAHGYALLSYKLSNRPVPINFPVSSFAMNKLATDSTKSYLLTRYAREQVSRQLPGELQLIEISPDSLIFQFANQVKRVIAVEPDLDYLIKKDFTIRDHIKIDPDSIQVTGPDIYIDTLQFIGTKPLSLGLLGKSFSGKLKILDYPWLTASKHQILCTIELEKLTEVQVEVPIQIIGLPDSIRMQIFPQKVKVTGKIGLSNYERIVPEAFWIEVKYADVLENKTRLPVQITTKPDNLSVVNYYPQTVEYILSVN